MSKLNSLVKSKKRPGNETVWKILDDAMRAEAKEEEAGRTLARPVMLKRFGKMIKPRPAIPLYEPLDSQPYQSPKPYKPSSNSKTPPVGHFCSPTGLYVSPSRINEIIERAEDAQHAFRSHGSLEDHVEELKKRFEAQGLMECVEVRNGSGV